MDIRKDRLDTAEDVVDFVKETDFFGMVAIGLGDTATHTKIFQFAMTNVDMEEAVFRCLTGFLSGVTQLVGPVTAHNIILDSIKAATDLQKKTNITLQ